MAKPPVKMECPNRCGFKCKPADMYDYQYEDDQVRCPKCGFVSSILMWNTVLDFKGSFDGLKEIKQ